MLYYASGLSIFIIFADTYVIENLGRAIYRVYISSGNVLPEISSRKEHVPKPIQRTDSRSTAVPESIGTMNRR